MDNLRAFKVTQNFDVNGNRKTTIQDLRNNKKVILKGLYIDDSEEIAVNFFNEKNIVIFAKFEVKKELYLLTHNFSTMIK